MYLSFILLFLSGFASIAQFSFLKSLSYLSFILVLSVLVLVLACISISYYCVISSVANIVWPSFHIRFHINFLVSFLSHCYLTFISISILSLSFHFISLYLIYLSSYLTFNSISILLFFISVFASITRLGVSKPLCWKWEMGDLDARNNEAVYIPLAHTRHHSSRHTGQGNYAEMYCKFCHRIPQPNSCNNISIRVLE